MNKKFTSTPNDSLISQLKDTTIISQLLIVKEYLNNKDASRYAVSVKTGIPLQTVCRCVNILFKSNSITNVGKKKCIVKGKRARILTTNEARLPKSKQLKLFCNEA
jgi:hypothetical protein